MTITYSVEEPTVPNGTVAMPIKKATISLDEIGYPGWKCTFRTNPRAELWDKFLSENDGEQVWENFSRFILEWNFGDEDGNPFPLPPTTKRGDLPTEVPAYLLNKFIDAFNQAAGLPKVQGTNSEATS